MLRMVNWHPLGSMWYPFEGPGTKIIYAIETLDSRVNPVSSRQLGMFGRPSRVSSLEQWSNQLHGWSTPVDPWELGRCANRRGKKNTKTMAVIRCLFFFMRQKNEQNLTFDIPTNCPKIISLGFFFVSWMV